MSVWYDMIYLLTAVGLTPGGSSTVHVYTQTVRRTTQLTQTIHRTTQLTNREECGPCLIFASYTLAFALQLRKKHGNTSVRVAEECQLALNFCCCCCCCKLNVIFMCFIDCRVLLKLKEKHLSCCRMTRGSAMCARQLAFCQP